MSESDEGPETVTLSQSKKRSKKESAEIRKAQDAVKERTRLRNRERDRRLKEQAEKRKEKEGREEGEESGDGDGDGVERMRRVIADGEESSESEEVDMFTKIEGLEEEESGSESESSMKFPEHLPDDLFASAFKTQAANAAAKKRKAKAKVNEESSARKRRRTKVEDQRLGSRAIRTLSENPFPTGEGTLPSSKVKKFLNKTLALKGDKKSTLGWERKPVNIGVLKRSGPASNFVRKK